MLREEKARLEESTAEAATLRGQLEEQKTKVKKMWRMNCEQISMYHDECCSKDDKIAALRARVAELESRETTVHSTECVMTSARSCVSPAHDSLITRPPCTGVTVGVAGSSTRRGKAPPVDSFSAENPETQFEDWLPTLRRAADWNGWSDEESLIQLAGHLRG